METTLDLTWLQRGLLVILYGLMLLMVIFSFLAVKNIGQEGYDNCIKEKCATHRGAFCSKFREISNCCQGAGGKMASDGQEYRCIFEN